MTSYAFPRSARLKHRSLIRPLFERGREDVASLAVGCIRLVMRVVSRTAAGNGAAVQVGFSPGRRVRTAVRRNRVKRKLREVYRLNQKALSDQFSKTDDTLTLMILYRGLPEDEACIDRDLPRALGEAARAFG